MRKLLNRKIAEQNRQCAICEVAFTNYNDIVPDHIDPRGMGGSRRDDHTDNIQAVHFWCNGEKGTREYWRSSLGFLCHLTEFQTWYERRSKNRPSNRSWNSISRDLLAEKGVVIP